MSLPITQEAAPLTTDPAGVVRVRGTRVTLDTVAHAFREGASAEEVASRYPSLSLPDVYAVIAYYAYNAVNLNRGYPLLEIRTPREVPGDERALFKDIRLRSEYAEGSGQAQRRNREHEL